MCATKVTLVYDETSDKAVRCSVCGERLPEDSTYCSYCGSDQLSCESFKRIDFLVCEKCGSELPDDSVFCQYCGSNKVSKKTKKENIDTEHGNHETIKPEIDTSKEEKVWSYEQQKYVSKEEYDSKKTAEKSGESKNQKLALFLICGGIILFFIICSICASVSSRPTNTFPATNVPFDNGEVVQAFGLSSEAENPYEYTVTAPKDENVFVYIKTVEGDGHLSFLIKKGEAVSVKLPGGLYRMYFAVGDNWKGLNDMFGSSTVYYKETRFFNTDKYDKLSVDFNIKSHILNAISKREFFDIYDKRVY
jgi:ribosomal protein L40E